MKLNPQLTFNGQCEAAFKFYERCLGGKIVTMFSYGDSPMAEQTPPEWREKILHATLTVGDNILMGGDGSRLFAGLGRISSWACKFRSSTRPVGIMDALPHSNRQNSLPLERNRPLANRLPVGLCCQRSGDLISFERQIEN